MASKNGEKGPTRVQLDLIVESEAREYALFAIESKTDDPRYPYASIILKGGDTHYVCGGCGEIMVAETNRGNMIGLAFKCLSCGSFNAVRGT